MSTSDEFGPTPVCTSCPSVGSSNEGSEGNPIARREEALENIDRALQITLPVAKGAIGLAGERVEKAGETLLEGIERADVMATTGNTDPEMGGAAANAVEIAKNFQPLAGSPFQVARAHVELDAEGKMVMKTPFGSVPPPPVLAPNKRPQAEPEIESLLPDIVIPGTARSGSDNDA